MRQLISGMGGSSGWSSGDKTIQLHGGNVQGNPSVQQFAGYVISPISIGNLSVEDDIDGAVWTICRVALDGAITTTSVSATSSGGRGESTNSADFEAGDLFILRRTGGNNSDLVTVSYELVTSSDYKSYYFFGLNIHAGPAQSAGALGAWSFTSNTTSSQSFSLIAINGTVTGLGITGKFDFFGPGVPDPTQGFDAWLVLDEVVQDGTGGTVDTKCSVRYTDNGVIISSVSEFSLPVVIGQRLDLYRESINGPLPSLSLIGFTVEFTSTTPGEFNICGAIGTVPITANDLNYGAFNSIWGSTEATKNLGGISSFQFTGLQYDRNTPFGVGNSMTLKAQRNFENPANQPTVTINAGETYVIDDDTDHKLNVFSRDSFVIVAEIAISAGTEMFWSMAAVAIGPSGPGGGIYKMVARTNDELYTEVGTSEVKIPDPFLVTAQVLDNG
jgi:hypothetical protein